MTSRTWPLHGAENPSTEGEGTNPGPSAPRGEGRGRHLRSAPNTPGMPAPSERTAWDFLPTGFRRDGASVMAPSGFSPVTQLEHARLGTVTPEMRRVAEREPHLSPEQVRDEIAAGR